MGLKKGLVEDGAPLRRCSRGKRQSKRSMKPQRKMKGGFQVHPRESAAQRPGPRQGCIEKPLNGDPLVNGDLHLVGEGFDAVSYYL